MILLENRVVPLFDFSSLSRGLCACILSHFSCFQLFATPWTVALLAPLSMGCSRQEYYSGLPCPPSGDLPDPGIKPLSLRTPELAGGFFTTSGSWEVPPIVPVEKFFHSDQKQHKDISSLHSFSKLYQKSFLMQ